MQTNIIDIEGLIVLIHEFKDEGEQFLFEAKLNGNLLAGQYSYKKHQPHNSTGEYHLHVYKKGNEIFSINQSGKGHDGYSGTMIPNVAFDALKSKFPDWNWPENQIIESLDYNVYVNASRFNLRKVNVVSYKLDGQDRAGFQGYFHTFGDDSFLTGGSGGYISRTIAIVEDESGYIRKVPVDYIRFIENQPLGRN